MGYTIGRALCGSAGKRYKSKMGQKDIAEKRLESYNDVFADIVNALLFSGEKLIAEDQLEDGPTGKRQEN